MKLTLDEAYQKIAASKVPPMPILTGPIDESEWAEVRAIDAEYAAQEAMAACSEEDLARHAKVHEALQAAGATLDNPGPLRKRIEATINLGGPLAALLVAERRMLAAQLAAGFTVEK